MFWLNDTGGTRPVDINGDLFGVLGLPRLEEKKKMLFYVDPQSGVPIFRQLMDQVKLHIASGALQPEDELPSIRNLSVPLGVNPMTISKAYNLLVRDGVLERRPGKPLIVANFDQSDLVDRRQEQLQGKLKPVVSLVRQLDIDPAKALQTFEQMLVDEDLTDHGGQSEEVQ